MVSAQEQELADGGSSAIMYERAHSCEEEALMVRLEGLGNMVWRRTMVIIWRSMQLVTILSPSSCVDKGKGNDLDSISDRKASLQSEASQQRLYLLCIAAPLPARIARISYHFKH